MAARLAPEIAGHVVAITLERPALRPLGSWGADRIVHLVGDNVEEDVAAAVATWTHTTAPWAIVTGSTAWGREVASRIAARLGAGLTGDAVDLEVAADRLVAWKPAFGGQLVAAIEASSPIQMATVRPGMLPPPYHAWRRASRRRDRVGAAQPRPGVGAVRGTTTSTSSPMPRR